MAGPSILLMRMKLGPAPLPAPVLPACYAFTPFDAARHARPARELLNAAYAGGGGDVLAFEDWWPAVESDAEFDPALCLALTETASGAMAGFAQCWSSGFVKDIGVRPGLRRLGLGRALMTEVFRIFQARGIFEVCLKVHADNPSGAPAFYRALGMVDVPAG